MEQDLLIRISVLSRLLGRALEESDDERFVSAQLLDELRAIGSQATEALNGLATSDRE